MLAVACGWVASVFEEVAAAACEGAGAVVVVVAVVAGAVGTAVDGERPNGRRLILDRRAIGLNEFPKLRIDSNITAGLAACGWAGGRSALGSLGLRPPMNERTLSSRGEARGWADGGGDSPRSDDVALPSPSIPGGGGAT